MLAMVTEGTGGDGGSSPGPRASPDVDSPKLEKARLKEEKKAAKKAEKEKKEAEKAKAKDDKAKLKEEKRLAKVASKRQSKAK